MNKNIYIAITAFVVLTAFGIYLWQTQTPTAPVAEQPKIQEPAKVTPPVLTPEQEAAALNKELEGINVNDLESEFKSIDTDLKSL
jgi:hypothetical protein